MILTSPSFKNRDKIPPKFTCDGGNINPELIIQNIPEDAKSLVLIVDDPDAVSGNFLHWMVWNIDPQIERIKQESIPPGAPLLAGTITQSVEGYNGGNKIGYTGPCPPDKKPHRYFFKLYALDTILKLGEEATKEDLESAVADHAVDKAELVGIYER